MQRIKAVANLPVGALVNTRPRAGQNDVSKDVAREVQARCDIAGEPASEIISTYAVATDLNAWPSSARTEAASENDIELPILYSEHLTGDGQEMLEHAAKLKAEIA